MLNKSIRRPTAALSAPSAVRYDEVSRQNSSECAADDQHRGNEQRDPIHRIKSLHHAV